MRYSILAIAALSVPWCASASVVISEVMYDLEGTDTKREWIEITNVSTAPVNPVDVVFFEANTSHKLKVVSGGSVLAPGASAIVALDSSQFLADNATFAGFLVDSSWSSLSNDGESLELRDTNGVVLDQVSYAKDMGAAGNGMSLMRSGSGFIEANPTPGSSSGSLPAPRAMLVSNKEQNEQPQNPKPSESPVSLPQQQTQPEPAQTQEVLLPQNAVSESVQTPHIQSNDVPFSQNVSPQEVEKPKPANSNPKNAKRPVVQEVKSPVEELQVEEKDDAIAGQAESLQAQVLSAETQGSTVWLYILALIGVLGVGSMAVVLVQGNGSSGRKEKTKEADSYTIVE